MADRVAERADPARLWPAVRSIVMVGMSYAPDHDPLEIIEKKQHGAVSVYAQSRDYHDVIKAKLKRVARFMIESHGVQVAKAGRSDTKTARSDTLELGSDRLSSHNAGDQVRSCHNEPTPPAVKVFVDTAPVMEKPLAAAAGLGWQGKHTVLVSRSHGSWLFLGAIYTTLELEPDEPSPDHCGRCTRCLSICPTDAFPKPYQLDATKCIAYLTIEHKGPIDRALRPKIGNRIFGCDDCLAVCPWNRFAQTAREVKLQARADLKAPRLSELSRLDDAAFRLFFAGTPIKRTGRDRFMRNVLIAMGNSGDASLVGDAKRLLGDASALVRGAAIWALSRLVSPEDFETLRGAHFEQETELQVREEWLAGRTLSEHR